MASEWFARPVLRVADVEASLAFYCERLGFTSPWRYDEGGTVFVAQVERDGCALILASNTPQPAGALVFVSLNVEPHSYEAAVEAIDALRAEFLAHGVAVRDGEWGYRLLVVEDLDGNLLWFNYPHQESSR